VATEYTLVNKIKKAILEHYPDAWVFKVVGSPQQESGVPDLLVCVRGRLVGIEVKYRRPRESAAAAVGRATPLQVAQLAKMHRAGAVVGVVLDVEGALGLIAHALNSSEKSTPESP